MSSDYETLLDATIHELETLRRSGSQFVRVERNTLLELSKPVLRQTKLPAVSVSEAFTPAPALVQVAASDRPRFRPDEKESAMGELRRRVMQCQQCSNLVATRKNIVFGIGNVHSELMFVGEAPGADEDVQGEPFVGNAGQLLNKIIKAMGYTREGVYIANVLKCRPDTTGQISGNRKPTTSEMATCLPYLIEQINIVQPKVIVALGGTAMEGLFGRPVYITKLRGSWHKLGDIPVMPTYHPSYLLHNAVVGEKRKLWEDMLQVMQKLARPISEKQRNFFIKEI